MLRILSIVLVVLMIVCGVLFVWSWNTTTPWGAGTGTIHSNEVKVGAVAPLPHV